MNDEELEARLTRWQPADPPQSLVRRLRAAEPGNARGAGWLHGWRQPWPLAYTGLLAAWALILVLRMLTPPGAAPTLPRNGAQAAVPADAPTFAGTLAAEHMFVFSRHDPDQF